VREIEKIRKNKWGGGAQIRSGGVGKNRKINKRGKAYLAP